ncbi:MAG: hypothetical protein ABR572_06680 [Cryomorphaceae bacterium]
MAKKYPRQVVLFVWVLLTSAHALGQGADNLRSKSFEILSDTTSLDTLSIVPESEIVYLNGEITDTSRYEIDYSAAIITWKAPFPKGEAEVKYRVFSFSFSDVYMRRSMELIQPDEEYLAEPYTYRPQAEQESLFGSSQLNKTGSISRGVGFGNAQDLTVNSTLSLQLNGQINDRISIVASITDDNIPIQPEGNTATLQEFDQVYIQLFDDRSKLTAGDFFLSRPTGYFTNYYKRGQGATFSTRQPLGGDEEKALFTETSAALSRGKFARNIITGQEGNQGPYPLRGNENELFIIVLAGTERVFIDGREMQRGQENDYVIDYNTSEITFTANQLINKDKRIAVEFQYTDANYARSMVQTSTGIETEKFSFYVNFFSEQDAKNQPLQQELTDDDRRILDAAGDDISMAIAPSFQQVAEFNNSQVLYQLTDSLGFDSVFVRAVADTEAAVFQVNFSEVGQGQGDYVQEGFDATGRVFKWVAPDVTGGEPVRQGNYAPVRQLVAPRQNQMLMIGGTMKLTERTLAKVEAGFSNQDRNTFSERNNENNVSHGFMAQINQEQPLSKNPDPLTLTGGLMLESIGENFQPIEPYRDVEFNRDWNLTQEMIARSQNILTANLGLQKAKDLDLDYSLNSFQAGNIYRGTKHALAADADYKGLDVWFRGSLLETDGIEKSTFARHRSRVEKSIGIAKIGFEDEREENRRFRPESDSLSSMAYKFYDWQFYITNQDSSRLDYKVFYRERTDYATEFNNLGESTHASHYGIELGLVQNPKHQFKASLSNRVLNITNEELTNNAPERTLLSRVEHSLRLAKNSIVTNTYYELGSGLERRQEFIFILDPTGQGPYTWIDYNENGIKELNEFELARPEDGERYIRVFTPTNDYIRAFSNQFSQSVNINPAAAWMGKEGARGVMARFSNQSAFRISRRTQIEDGLNRLNPFASDISDTTLISQSSSIRNTLFYNRTSSKFGVDYTYSNQASKNPFTGGFEEREQTVHTGRLRYNVTPEYGLVSEQELGNRSSFSDIAEGRNFNIDYYTAKQTFSYQPGTSFRLSFTGKYTFRNNEESLGGEKAELIDIGLDMRANKMESGSFFGHLNYISIEYTGAANNSVAYEMLDGLQNGGNFTWGAGVQRQLGKSMQLSLSYNGRKSEDIDAIHTGNVQVRAFF